MERAYLGDLLARAADAVGLSSIVVDGCVRDKLGLKELAIPVYSKGIM
jgi:regulator of RNase E activity RraA